MSIVSERRFLIKALVVVFLLQFIVVCYQIHSCQEAIRSPKETDKVVAVCTNASNSFNETGKLALTTFLALLVPMSSQSTTPKINREEDKKDP